MRFATTEEIAAFVKLANVLELRAIEQELARAVSVVDAVGGSAARALFDRCEILETGYAACLAINAIGQGVDTGHERVEDVRETLTFAGFHWKWRERPKAAYACETSHVPNTGGVLQHSRVFVAFAHRLVASRDRDRPVVLPKRTVIGDRALVVDDAPRSGLGEARLLGLPFGTGRQSGLEVVSRQEVTRQQQIAEAGL